MRTGLVMVMVGVVLSGSGCVESGRPAGSDLAINWQVVDNREDGFRSQLTVQNNSVYPLRASDRWSLFFTFVRFIDSESVSPSISIRNINGQFNELRPADGFEPLEPGESRSFEFDASDWATSQSDAPNGFYLVYRASDGSESPPEEIGIVTSGPFSEPEQTRRSPNDHLPVVTPAQRFRDNHELSLLSKDELGLMIIPTPASVTRGTGSVGVSPEWQIRYGDGLEEEAGYLASALEPTLNSRLFSGPGGSGAEVLNLETGPVRVGRTRLGTGAEAYRLRITAGQGISIRGSDPAGVFYGIQTLLSLIPPGDPAASNGPVEIPAVDVQDNPRFGYRGMHLDVARNFQSKDAVKKLLDLMARYKLNRFHFHLTDDEGWRLEIRDLPELTEVGSRRGHTLDESDRLFPSYGSGPDPDSPANHGSGFYSRQDFIEILRHARSRHIEVIPELDAPGHARAAIQSMEARALRLRKEGREEEAGRYLLSDPDDRSQYRSAQYWNDNVVNACLDSSYAFLEKVVDEIQVLYREARVPLTAIHVGGDEVPEGIWEGSPACRTLIAERDDLDSASDLPGEFLRRFAAILFERNLTMAGWEEIALSSAGEDSVRPPDPAFLDQGVRAYAWNSIWGWGGEDNGYRLANAGYQVVLCNASNLYMDMANEKDPAEPGFYWAGYVNTRRAFEFAPLNLYVSARLDLMGNPIAPGDLAGKARLNRQGRRNILGIQAHLWSETVIGVEAMEYMAFPKLLAVAERAWKSESAWERSSTISERDRLLEKDWNRFANLLGQRELRRLDTLLGGVSYRIPPPGAIVEGGLLKANVAFPGLMIRFTTDGTEPTMESPAYDQPVPVEGTVRLRTFNSQGRGSRTMTVSP